MLVFTNHGRSHGLIIAFKYGIHGVKLVWTNWTKSSKEFVYLSGEWQWFEIELWQQFTKVWTRSNFKQDDWKRPGYRL